MVIVFMFQQSTTVIGQKYDILACQWAQFAPSNLVWIMFPLDKIFWLSKILNRAICWL